MCYFTQPQSPKYTRIKIYYGDKPVYLWTEMNDSLNELLHHLDICIH